MSISCPNKRLVAWKNLVKTVGENKAYVLWSEYDGNVPDNYYKNEVVLNNEIESIVSSKEVDFTDVTSNNETTIFENITP